MDRLKQFSLLLLLSWMFTSTSCFAYDPSGVWSSSTSSSIRISADTQRVTVTVVTIQGSSKTFNGYWTRYGENFAYQSQDGMNYAAFNGRDQIRVQPPNGRALVVWNRTPQNNARHVNRDQNYNNQNTYASNADISGLWRSTSGSSVQITTRNNQVFVTLIDKNGRRFQGSGRWLQYGRTFDYSFPGYSDVSVGTVAHKNQINVRVGNSYNEWYRQ